MNMANTILGLRAETSIHAGTGQNTGVIDLPIQREAHTGWPCVFGSAMKGAIRAHAETRGQWSKQKAAAVFGADDASTASHVAITDARLLLLPVRSLTGHFKWVSCPAVLKRLKRDMELIGSRKDVPLHDVPENKVVSHKGGDPLFLEEFQFEQEKGETGKIDAIFDLIAAFGIDRDELKERLVIMGDDDFADFCGTATAITPHIAINSEKKTVVPGALWYEESLPSDSLLYTLLMGKDEAIDDVRSMLTEGYLQVGGNETVGMGWCRVKEVQA